MNKIYKMNLKIKNLKNLPKNHKIKKELLKISKMKLSFLTQQIKHKNKKLENKMIKNQKKECLQYLQIEILVN